MGAFNGGALLIVVALVAFLVFRREIAAWVDGPPRAGACELCGKPTATESLCSRCHAVCVLEAASLEAQCHEDGELLARRADQWRVEGGAR